MSREDDISRLLPYLYSREQAAAIARSIADFVDARIREAMKPPETSEPGDTLVPHAADCASRRSAVVGAGGNRIGASMQPLPCSCDYWERALAANVKLAKPVPVQPEATASDEDVCQCTHVTAHPSLYGGCPYHECFVCGDPASEFGDDGGAPHDYRCAGHSRRRTPEATAHKTSESGNDSDRVRGTPIAVTDAPAIAPKEPALSHPAPVGAEAPVRVTLFASEDGEDVYLRKPSFIPNTNPVAYVRADVYEKAVEALRALVWLVRTDIDDGFPVPRELTQAESFLRAHDAASTRK